MSDTVTRILRTLHRWIGLALALPLLIQAATGFVLAITPPFDALRLPRSQPFMGPPPDIAAIIAAAQFAEPAELIPLRYEAGATERDTATVDLARPGQRVPEVRIFVEPGSLAVLDWRERPNDFYLWAHALHETLLIPGPLGHNLVGWSGLGLLALGLSGIPIWWPRRGRWKAALSVSFAARGYRFQRALHGAAGGWFAALLILQSLSGASMAFPGVFATILGAPVARMPMGGHQAAHEIDPDAIAEAARAAAPGAALTSLRYPTQPGRPMIATLLPDGQADGAPPVVVFGDPSNGHVIGVRDPRSGSSGAFVLAWLRALHSGGGLGPIWRVAICATGAALPLFPITGVAMWLLRRRRQASRTVLQGASE
jgi:uncharacterized iron-regulated membrane protein